MATSPEFVYVRRLRDGKILDIPAKHLDQTLKRGGFEVVQVAMATAVYESSDIEFPPTPCPFECPFCGVDQKNAAGLARHKINHA